MWLVKFKTVDILVPCYHRSHAICGFGFGFRYSYKNNPEVAGCLTLQSTATLIIESLIFFDVSVPTSVVEKLHKKCLQYGRGFAL